LVTAAFGAAAGALAARWIVGAVMKLDFVAPWGAMAGAAGIALAVALGLGLADSLRALRAPPARALREP
ncbi:MAG: hypothetical protein KGI57_11995, partial [Hyphomicrobiales bacterium]|nr:hypothetical protein [Hyphomicrobiales bacterium]